MIDTCGYRVDLFVAVAVDSVSAGTNRTGQDPGPVECDCPASDQVVDTAGPGSASMSAMSGPGGSEM